MSQQDHQISNGCSRNYPHWGGQQRFFFVGGWMHNNVKFILKDEDIQVWWGSWYSDLSWG